MFERFVFYPTDFFDRHNRDYFTDSGTLLVVIRETELFSMKQEISFIYTVIQINFCRQWFITTDCGGHDRPI